MSDFGDLIAVALTAEVPAAALNKFLKEAYDGTAADRDTIVVVIEDLNKKYTEPTVTGIELDSSYPLKGKTPLQVFEALVELRRNVGADIDYQYFIILDDRFLKDSSAMIAVGDVKKNHVETVRTVTKEAIATLMSISAGVSSIKPLQEDAAMDPDGVLRD